MERDLIVFESGQWQLTEAAVTTLSAKGTLQRKAASFGGQEIIQFLNSHQALSIHGIFIPTSLVGDGKILNVIEAHPLRNQVIFIEADGTKINKFTRIRAQDLEDAALLDHLFMSTATKRLPGIKAFLERGSTIYSENVFKVSGLGVKLDPCFELAASQFGETKALHIWHVLGAIINHAFVGLNQYLEEDANKRIKIQLGVDSSKFCFGVSYPVTSETVKDLYVGLEEIYTKFKENHWLAAWQEASSIEVTHYAVGKRGEIIVFFEREKSSAYLPFVARCVNANELEAAEDAKTYTYKLFTAIKEAIEKGDTKVVAGAKPKKKLSERMSSIAQKHGGEAVVIKGVTQKIEGGTTVIKGTPSEKDEAKTVIKGATDHINNESTIKVSGGTGGVGSQETAQEAVNLDSDEAAVAEALKSLESEGVGTEEELDQLQAAVAPSDENDILAAIAEVAGQIEGTDGAAEPAKEATPAAKTPAPAAKNAKAPANPAAEKNPEVAALKSAAEQEKLKKMFSMESAKKEKDAGKLMAILEDRLSSAKEIISNRENLITKLYKQIEEIMDPTKSNVISGVVDTQREGLKQNVTRLETELAEAGKREKELMTSVDKSVQAKDEAVKKLKAAETKAQAAETAAAAKIKALEKALETERALKAELAKKAADSTGKKAA